MSHITDPGRTGEWPLKGSVTIERKLQQHHGVELKRYSPSLTCNVRWSTKVLFAFVYLLTMPQRSANDCSGQDCHDHSHDHSDDLGPQDNLYTYIDRQNVVALNISGDHHSSLIIKPWHQRMDENLVSMVTDEVKANGDVWVLVKVHRVRCRWSNVF